MMRLSPARILEARRREALLVRIERLTELPLLILAFVTLPLIVGPFFWDLSSAEIATFASISSFIWAVFTAVLITKLLVAPHRVNLLKRNWLEVLIVIAPFAMPLRLVGIVLYGSRAFAGARRLANADFLLVYGIGLIMLGATVITTVEVGAEGSNITSFPDALWWSVVTMTTVGYGDRFPVTTLGRAVALVIMIGGIGFFSGLTANLATFFIHSDKTDDKEEMRRLIQQIEMLNNRLGALDRDEVTNEVTNG